MNNSRFIYFAGVDGCGKSTIIEEIIKEYKKNGVCAKSVWLRFNYFFTKPILLLCRVIGLTRRVNKAGKIYSIHDFQKSETIARLVQYLHYMDTALAYFFKVYIPLRFTDRIILCDKFVYDILADFIVETKDLNLLNKNITKLFLKLLPENIPVIYFSVDKDEIIKRKPEVLIDDEDYDFKYKVYQVIMKKFQFTVIKNDNYEDTVSQVTKVLNIKLR